MSATTALDFVDANCIGDWQTFDSSNASDIAAARILCRSCPARLACGQLLGELRQEGAVIAGTWAGTYFGRRQKGGSDAA